jgi:hypothetical protein
MKCTKGKANILKYYTIMADDMQTLNITKKVFERRPRQQRRSIYKMVALSWVYKFEEIMWYIFSSENC